MTSSRELWYLTRGSGVVALLVLTASVVVGILTSLRVASRPLPRFAVAGLHRYLTLLSIAFVALHVVTTVADGYAPIGLKDAIVPFASPYRAVWLGLGAVAFDLLLALAITSYLRARIGIRTWRGLHWLAYVLWPVALLHSAGTGSDARVGWFEALAALAVIAVALAVLARLVVGGGSARVRAASAAVALAAPVALAAWYAQGPAAKGWAARAGTPKRLMASRRTVRTQSILTSAQTTPSPPRSFTARVHGTVRETQGANGEVDVVIVMKLADGLRGAFRLDLRGQPIDGGVSMQQSGVSFVPASTRSVYLGAVTALAGSAVAATVKDAAGDTLDLTLALSLDPSTGIASGTIRGTTPGGGEAG